MKTTTKPAKVKVKVKVKAKSSSRVPFEEMQRLMRVYGSLKCLRKRQTSVDQADVKVVSVKRKFYRWFPDLEERFVRDPAGFYRPKFGHEFEMRYREEMRAKDGEVLTKKRNKCRKQRVRGKQRAKAETTHNQRATAASFIVGNAVTAPPALSNHSLVSRECSPIVHENNALASKECSPIVHFGFDQQLSKSEHGDVQPKLGNDRSAPLPIIDDSEPLDGSFVAEHGIFDDVERNFFGLGDDRATRNHPDLPLVTDSTSLQSSSSCGSDTTADLRGLGPICSGSESAGEGSCPTQSWESDSSSSIDDLLDKTMEEYCEEILADGDDTVPNFRFEEL